jgi:hypothetical protein
MTGWYLLTNLQVNNFEKVEKILDSYTKRWTIEDFHKCYKTGCSIENYFFTHSSAPLPGLI